MPLERHTQNRMTLNVCDSALNLGKPGATRAYCTTLQLRAKLHKRASKRYNTPMSTDDRTASAQIKRGIISTFIERRLTEECTSPTIVSSEVKKGNLEFSRHNYSTGVKAYLSATMKRCKERQWAEANVIDHIALVIQK